MRITIALLPGSDLESAMEQLLPAWMTHGVHIVLLPDQGSPELSEPDHPIAQGIDRLVLEQFGNAHVGTYYQTRSLTDARFFREHGIPSYGFSPFLVLTTDTLGNRRVRTRASLSGHSRSAFSSTPGSSATWRAPKPDRQRPNPLSIFVTRLGPASS